MIFHVYFIDENFMTSVAALHDVYCVLKKYSEKLQDVQAFPWDRTKAFDDLIQDLEQLQAQIPDSEPTLEENDLTDNNNGWIFLSTHAISSEQVIRFSCKC